MSEFRSGRTAFIVVFRNKFDHWKSFFLFETLEYIFHVSSISSNKGYTVLTMYLLQ